MSRSFLTLTILAILFSLSFLSSGALSKKIFISQADVTKIVESDVAPVTSKLETCHTIQATYRKELVTLTKDSDSISDEIKLIIKLKETVQSNIHEKHDEHKEKLNNLLDNLLKKLNEELAAQKVKVDQATEKLNKKTAECDTIELHRFKYIAAIQLISMAEVNMRYADTYIPQLKGAAAKYLAEYNELKDTNEGHLATIEAHKNEINKLNDHHDTCEKELEKLKKDKEEYNTCKNDVEIFTKDQATCKTENENAINLHTNLEDAVEKLQSRTEELHQSAEKWKELANAYKPKVAARILDEKIKPVYNGPRKMCWSTGDPHYSSFTGARFDVYGFAGDFLLIESPDKEFIVETRIAYNRVYGNRGLNQGVAIKADGVIIESLGGNVKVDGTVINVKAGVTVNIRRGVTIHRVNGNTYQVNDPNGGRVQFSIHSISGWIYHNVWAYVPNDWVGQTEGLCAGKAPNTAQIRSFQITDKSERRAIFGTVYNPPTEGHVVAKLAWKSRGFQLEAEEMCFKVLGARGAIYHDCLLDAKIAGNLDILDAYKQERQAVKELENADKKFTTGPLGQAYRFLAHLLQELTLQEKQLTEYEIVDGLKGMKLDTPIALSVEAIEARLKREIRDIRVIQSELAVRIN